MRLIYPPFSVSFVESPSARSKSQTYARNCKANSIDLWSKISWANEKLCPEIQANNDSITDSILSLLKVILTKISHKDDIIETRSPKTSHIAWNFNTNQQTKTTKLSHWNFFQKGHLIKINAPLFKTYNVRLPSPPVQLCAPIFTKSSSPSPIIEKSDTPIRLSAEFYFPQKFCW